jgi:hypothetical protein
MTVPLFISAAATLCWSAIYFDFIFQCGGVNMTGLSPVCINCYNTLSSYQIIVRPSRVYLIGWSPQPLRGAFMHNVGRMSFQMFPALDIQFPSQFLKVLNRYDCTLAWCSKSGFMELPKKYRLSSSAVHASGPPWMTSCHSCVCYCGECTAFGNVKLNSCGYSNSDKRSDPPVHLV